jgi:hypothetical protein
LDFLASPTPLFYSGFNTSIQPVLLLYLGTSSIAGFFRDQT